jgi:hypothetical protein
VEGFGEIVGEVFVVDCFLEWVNGAAGGSARVGDLRLALESLIHCERN